MKKEEEKQRKIAYGRALLRARQPLPHAEEEEKQRKIAYGRALLRRARQPLPPREEEERQRKITYGRALLRARQPLPPMEEEERQMKIAYGRALLKARQPLSPMEEEERQMKIAYGRALLRTRQPLPPMEEEERQMKIAYGRALLRTRQSLPPMEEEERQRKIACVRALLYKFKAAVKERDFTITQLRDKLQQANKEKEAIMRHFSKLTKQSKKLQNEFQHLYKFKAAVKERDFIITQLRDKLQLANSEKEEIMRHFSKLTEQSKKLQNEFQHLEKQTMSQIENLKYQQKGEIERTLSQHGAQYEEQLKFLRETINELHIMLRYSHFQKQKFREELRLTKLEKCTLQYQCEVLSKEVRSLKDQPKRFLLSQYRTDMRR